MTTRPARELSFQCVNEWVTALEIDADVIPDARATALIQSTLAQCAAKDESAIATIYALRVPRRGPNGMTHADLFCVMGYDDALAQLTAAFAHACGDRVRIRSEAFMHNAAAGWHIESGSLWMPDDPDNWYAYGSTWMDKEPPDVCGDIENPALTPEVLAPPAKAMGRFRAARSDAKVGRIRERIESIFGLPEGSVLLCGPDGRPLRADARIRTLRVRWDQ
jgi:hypothetical protein